MKRLRSYGEELDDAAGKDWERREIDSDRSSSRRRFYIKPESLRRSALSLYDRSVDVDRELMRPPRKRFEFEADGSDKRKVFDRYRDGGGGSGSSAGGLDRAMHVSSSRNSYGSEQMHRAESLSGIRSYFPKGFRSERDRSQREVCGGLSWRRLSNVKDATKEEKTPPIDSKDRSKTRSWDSSGGKQSKHLEATKAEMENIQGESCSSSEMEEGELKHDPLPEPSTDTTGHADDSQNCEDKEDETKKVSQLNSENKDTLLSNKSDYLDGAFGEERSLQTEVDQVTGKNEHVELLKELGMEIREEGEGLTESEGQREVLTQKFSEEEEFAEGVCNGKKLEDTYFLENKKIICFENSNLPNQGLNYEMKNAIEAREGKDDELAIVYSPIERNLEDKLSKVYVSEVGVDAEKKEEMRINLEIVQWKEKSIDQVGFDVEQSQIKGIGFHAEDAGDTDCFSSDKEIAFENNLSLKPMANKIKENLKDKGKSIAHTLSHAADSVENEDAVEAPCLRGFELIFKDHIAQPDKASICGPFAGSATNKKLKFEPLDLSLGLPGAIPDVSSIPPNLQSYSPGCTKSIQSFPSSFRTTSDGFTNSITFSNSQPFVHNPSCSLTQNSLDNYEHSVGSRPIFQGVDQVSSGTIWPSLTIVEPKRKGGAGALFHRVLMNGNHSPNSIKIMNGHHHLNSNAFLRQQSYPRQPSPPQSVGSHDMLPEYCQDKRILTKEKCFNSAFKCEQQEGEEVIVNTPNVVEMIITRIVSEPLQVMERILQDMTENSIKHLKDSICKMLANPEKCGQIYSLQMAMQRRPDLTAEAMTKCPRTLLEILVALKTDNPSFLQKSNNASSSDLVAIYHNLKCRNIACRNVLPVDDCDCKICSQKNGFCSACMCLICSKFDMASNTCSWVGCDVCLHWCHTDCGLHGSNIRNGRNFSMAPGATEMQFHCVSCGHPSEMFGFVKEVFKMCSKDWKVENLEKELQYVRRIFFGSNDLRGKGLYQFAGQMLVKLEDKKKHAEVKKNIMSFLSASKTKIYIVMEFVDGGELFDKIVKCKRLKEDEARRYFHQLINAVDYCHSRGVYHRDLKPENLLLDSSGTLKVSDLGLSAFSQQVRDDGLLHTACGTPNYVAPEVLNDKGYDGKASDIWSCGVILFVLMAGYLPFDETNLNILYMKISKAEFSCPSWFSSSAKTLIKRILNPNPLFRITVPEILVNEWFKKGYKPPNFEQTKGVTLDDVDAVFNDSQEHFVTEKKEKPESMNAFSLISRSQGFNLGNLFENQMGIVKRETSFTSSCSPNEIMSKIEETAKPLGFNVHKHNYKMKLKGDKSGRKGHLSVATEVFEVAPSLHMVELRKTGGDTLEFHNFYNTFSTGLKDVFWKTDSTQREKS